MKKYNILLILSIFFLIGVTATYPLIFNFSNSIYSLGGDSYSLVYHFWWIKANTAHLTFPDNFLFMGLAKLLTAFLNEIVVYNILIFLGFIFTGFAGFTLTKKITSNYVTAIFGGIVFCLLPFRMTHSMEHTNFADLGFLLFFIYFLICARENPSFKNIFLSGLFLVLSTLWNYQYGFFEGIILLIYAIFYLVSALIRKALKFDKKIIYYISITLLFTALIIGFFNYKVFKDYLAIREGKTVEVVPIRSHDELKVYTAKWFYYLLPSPDNPFLGRWTSAKYNQAVKDLGTNRTEQVLYLGWIPIFLALYAILIAARKKFTIFNLPAGRQGLQFTNKFKIQNSQPEADRPLDEKIKNNVWFFVLLGLVGLALSFSETWNIFGYHIKSPAQYLFSYLPFFRVYARFGLLAGISTAVLAGIGLNILISKLKAPAGQRPLGRRQRSKLMLIILIFLLTICELLVWPKNRVIGVDHQAMPEVYKQLPFDNDCGIAEYPFLPPEAPKSYEYLLWQRIHQRNLLNNDYKQISVDDIGKIVDLNNPDNIGALNKYHVCYIIVHDDMYKNSEIKQYPIEYNQGLVPNLSNNIDLNQLGKFSSDDLYEIKDNQ